MPVTSTSSPPSPPTAASELVTVNPPPKPVTTVSSGHTLATSTVVEDFDGSGKHLSLSNWVSLVIVTILVCA